MDYQPEFHGHSNSPSPISNDKMNTWKAQEGLKRPFEHEKSLNFTTRNGQGAKPNVPCCPYQLPQNMALLPPHWRTSQKWKNNQAIYCLNGPEPQIQCNNWSQTRIMCNQKQNTGRFTVLQLCCLHTHILRGTYNVVRSWNKKKFTAHSSLPIQYTVMWRTQGLNTQPS